MYNSTLIKAGAGMLCALLLGVLLVASDVIALPLDGPRQPDRVLDAAERKQVLAGVIDHLERYYVFPDKAEAMAAVLRRRQQAGAYDGIASASKFATTLTRDLHEVSGDRHLDVGYSAEVIPPPPAGPAPQGPGAEELVHLRRLNFGVEAVRRLDFNIGYLDLRLFAPAELAAPRLAAAMTLLADTEALVIDLRQNHGGDPATVALLASYLFEQRTRLNDIYVRDGDRTDQVWTRDRVDGPRYGAGKAIYLLTSNDTFSAGEDFAYALKNLKRATVVGVATGGGAHPGDAYRINDHFGMIVPNARSISPITQGDWEGVGVIPDIEHDPDQALDHVQVLILTARLAAENDERAQARIRERLAELD